LLARRRGSDARRASCLR